MLDRPGFGALAADDEGDGGGGDQVAQDDPQHFLTPDHPHVLVKLYKGPALSDPCSECDMMVNQLIRVIRSSVFSI